MKVYSLKRPTVVIVSYIMNSKALMDFYREENQLLSTEANLL